MGVFFDGYKYEMILSDSSLPSLAVLSWHIELVLILNLDLVSLHVLAKAPFVPQMSIIPVL
jgi:hypothetical protein